MFKYIFSAHKSHCSLFIFGDDQLGGPKSVSKPVDGRKAVEIGTFVPISITVVDCYHMSASRNARYKWFC